MKLRMIMKAQRPKKKEKKFIKKERKRKEEDPNLGQEANQLRENLKILRRMQTA